MLAYKLIVCQRQGLDLGNRSVLKRGMKYWLVRTGGLSSLASLKITAASRALPPPTPGGERLYFLTMSSSTKF